MSKQAIDKSGEGQTNEVITVTSTLPPAKRGYDSGRFNRFSIRGSIKDCRELLNPTVGGALLREHLAWELLPAEIKNLIQPEMLEFIAQDPIPESEVIEKEISAKAEIAHKRLEVRKTLTENKQLPELIAVAIFKQMEHEIGENPDLPIAKILFDTMQLANEAIEKLNLESFPKDEASGRYCLIAHDVLIRRKSSPPQRVSPEAEEEAPDSECGRDTMPDTPDAIRKS